MNDHRIEIRNILCPTDFSEFSTRALDHAVDLALWFKCPVTALHVMPYISPSVLDPNPVGPSVPALPTDLLMERKEDVDAEMVRVAAAAASVGVVLRGEVKRGHAWREIEARAMELPADLVVLGTHGRSGWDRLLMGSTTEKLIRRLTCPVLTVGPGDVSRSGGLFRRVLCALDLTSRSAETLRLAFAFAAESHAKMTLLHVLDGDRPDWFPKEQEDATRKQIHDACRAAADKELARLRAEAPATCEVDVLVTMGGAGRAIVQMAEQIRADLVVIGAQGPAAISESFVGSTATHVLRHASCPVLLARRPRTPESH